MAGVLNPFTTGNPFLGTKLLGFSIGRGSGALEGLRHNPWKIILVSRYYCFLVYLGHWFVHRVGIQFSPENQLLGEV